MIHRDKHDGSKPGFTVISNQPINNKSLSLEALGLLLRILSLPDNWDFNINGLIKRFGLRRSTVIRVIKELETNGNIVRYRAKNENNQFDGWRWHVYEISDNEEKTTSENPDIEKSRLQKASTSENSDIEKSRVQKTPTSGNPDFGKSRLQENPKPDYSDIGKAEHITKTNNDKVLIKQITEHNQLSSKTNINNKRSMEINTNKGDKHCFGEYKKVRLSDKDVQNLFQKLGVEKTNSYIQILDDYLEGHPEKAYGNHYRTILSWVEKNEKSSDNSMDITSGNIFTEIIRQEGLT